MLLTTMVAAAVLGAAGLNDPAPAGTLYGFTMDDIDGKPKRLADFRGKVALVVNVASKCGLTPQYEGLEALYRRHKADGLVVLGFPANDFGNQEPGSNEEIKEFCTGKFDVTFPMFGKIAVTGTNKHPLYRWLIAESGRTDEIEWNFAKFVVGRDGKVRARFSPRTAPNAPELQKALAEALAEPAR